MRHYLTIITVFIVSFFFIGCEQKLEQAEEVSVYFVYNLPTDSGGSMTKTTNAEVFEEFYQKIISAELVAETYHLVLTESTTGAKYEFSGSWNSHDLITLRTGTYHIVGSSTATGENIQDKCSFVFDETVEISASSSAITLNAQYDCFLLIFSANDIASLSNYNGESTSDFFSFKSYKYAFVNSSLYKENGRNAAYIGGKYTDNAEFKCYTGNLVFEKGKYYVYSSITGSFSVPQMEEGGADITAVDLGLSVKWRSMNLGAIKETDYGDRYAWGETATKSSFTWGNYKWCKGSSSTLTKYCTKSSYGTVDNRVLLDEEDDAAHVVLGAGWRMPTIEEAQELHSNCTWTAETLNGVKGYRVASKINSNSIFIPLNGQKDETGVHYEGVTIYIWLNKCSGDYTAYHLAQSGVNNINHRHDGLAIRPVID